MRRKDREITDSAKIYEILDEAEIIRLAMVDGKEPYVVSMNYGYKDNALYLHSATEGRKIEILKRNNRVAFTVDTDVSLVLTEQAARCTTRYKSVFGTGHAVFIENTDEKIRAMEAIMEKHAGQGQYHFPEEVLKITAVIRIDIDYLSGKQND